MKEPLNHFRLFLKEYHDSKELSVRNIEEKLEELRKAIGKLTLEKNAERDALEIRIEKSLDWLIPQAPQEFLKQEGRRLKASLVAARAARTEEVRARELQERLQVWARFNQLKSMADVDAWIQACRDIEIEDRSRAITNSRPSSRALHAALMRFVFDAQDHLLLLKVLSETEIIRSLQNRVDHVYWGTLRGVISEQDWFDKADEITSWVLDELDRSESPN